ncbi:hypothetical protein [Dongia sp.]|uniref:hypothetical protein n=1 Tax=Dongia sp. TaxID=1977262 RepID=UPI0035AF13DA
MNGLELVPDCGGLIDEIAMTLPPFLFTPGEADKRRALQHLAEALPAGVTLLLLAERSCEGALTDWLSSLSLRCAVRPVLQAPRGTMRNADMWTQDPFLAGRQAGAPVLVPLPLTDHAGAHAQWLSAAGYGLLPAPGLHLAGGNHLTGPDFRIIGTASLQHAAGLDGDAALARHAALESRRLHVFGFPLAKRGQPATLAQQPHHIDLVLSVTGLAGADGRPLLLLADPRSGTDPDGPRVPGWAEQLDASAARLEADGFAVLRNRVPYLAHPRFSPNPSLRAYNNVIFENDTRYGEGRSRPLAWLPQFADLEPDLEAYDRANRRVWADLGFEPVPVHGWSALVRAGGALRCSSKVLKRAEGWPAGSFSPNFPG